MLNTLKRENSTETHPWDDLFGGRNEIRVSRHALREAHKEGLRGRDIIYAVLTGTVVERYPKRRRILISSQHNKIDLPIHVVCDYTDLYEVVVVTVYIPNRIRWAHPLRRRNSSSI
jgi:hypothetical protein